MASSQLLLIMGLFLVIGFPIAYFIGKKKRIGFGWTLFFSIFLTPVLALLLALLSPPLAKLPPDNPKDKVPYTLLACFIILGMVAGIIDAFRIDEYTEKAKGIDFAGVYRLIASLGLVIYLFGRSSRNRMLYESSNPISS